jgi:hypothetical protein
MFRKINFSGMHFNNKSAKMINEPPGDRQKNEVNVCQSC